MYRRFSNLFVLVFSFLFSISIFSQDSFLPGKIINSNNEELNVLIKYAEFANTPQSFYYKLEEKSKIVFINIDQIKEVNIFNKARYIKRLVVRNTNNGGNLSYDTTPDLKLKEEEIVIEELVSGFYNLYFYFGDNNSSFFYSINDQEIKPLFFKEYVQNDIVRKNYHFLNEIDKNINCDKNIKLKNKLKSLSYSSSDLSKYFISVNNCISGNEVVKNEKKDKSYIDLKVLANLNRITLYDNYMDFQPKGIVSLGFEMEYHLAFYNYLLALSISPSYMNYENETIYKALPTGNSFDASLKYNNQKVKISYSSISLPINLKFYPYRSNDFKASIEATLFPLLLTSKGDLKYENGETFNVKKLMKEAYIGVGFRYKNAGITFKKLFSQGIGYHVKGVAVGLNYAIWDSKRKLNNDTLTK